MWIRKGDGALFNTETAERIGPATAHLEDGPTFCVTITFPPVAGVRAAATSLFESKDRSLAQRVLDEIGKDLAAGCRTFDVEQCVARLQKQDHEAAAER